jgi:hypothetical protein
VKIADASIQMESSHASVARREVRESLRAWIGPRRPDFEGSERAVLSVPDSTVVHVSESARATQAAEAESIAEASEAAEDSPELQLIKSMVEMLTGRRIRVVRAEDIRPETESADLPDPNKVAAQGNAGWGIEYEYHETIDEAEATAYSAQGIVRTADGREIQFRIDLAMARSWHDESHVSLRASDGRRKDPLVLNFDGTAAELASARFRFDLDADGALDDVPLLAGGSGYLALDINGDGRITSGAELFGPQSGDGYADLARYDADGNRWIDENDAVFNRLRVWVPAPEGDGSLTTLSERAVGALYLGHLSTPFELRGSGNDSLGAIRSSGVFLTEDGEAGTLQQIDLTV